MADLSNWNILVVDDEIDNIGVLVLVLEFANAMVRTAVSGSECLTMLKDQLPTMLLLDIQMPEISGFEVIKIIRSNAAWKHLPVIAVTAQAMEGDEERIIEAGFDAYIAKPLNALTLADDLKSIMDKRANY